MNGVTHKIGGIGAGMLAASSIYGAGTIATLSLSNGIPMPIFNGRTMGLVCIAGGVFGSILLDIDKDRTTISNKFPLISKFVQIFTDHRGVMHTISMNVFLYYFFLWFLNFLVPFMDAKFSDAGNSFLQIINRIWQAYMSSISFISGGYSFLECIYPLVLGVFYGGISHILLDIITPDGAPLFWPITDYRVSIAKLDGEKHGPMVSLCIIVGILGGMYFGII